MTKVLVIGLDGATLDLVEPWAAAGKLPVMARMLSQGAYSSLESVQPTLSSAAWGSFMTGTNPGKHGLIDFVRRAPDSYRLRTLRRDHLQYPSLWRLLSEQGRRVGVMNVPMTYPPEAVNGFMVSGLGTPDYKPFTYPVELGQRLLSGGYRVNKRQVYRPGNEDAYLADVNQMADGLKASAQRLMREQPWDLFMVVFFDTDQLAHYFWHHMDREHPAHEPLAAARYSDAILHYYQKVDRYIGELVETAGQDTTVIIVSDHGTGPLYRDVLLNEWLKQNGYLATLPQGPVRAGRQAWLSRAGLTRSNISSALRGAGLGRVERWIKDSLGDRIEMLPRTGRAQFPEAIDWSRTAAYSFGYQGQIYVNLRGREPAGIVEPGANYRELCERIKRQLFDFRDPDDGLPVVDDVMARDEIFSGPSAHYAPDLLLVMRNLSYITRSGYEFSDKPGKIIVTPATHETGSHRLQGLCIMSGKSVSPGGRIGSKARLIDIAPTILHLLGCPVSAEMDGSVLHSHISFASEVRISTYRKGSPNPPAPDPSQADEWSDKDENELLGRLKDLGYLE